MSSGLLSHNSPLFSQQDQVKVAGSGRMIVTVDPSSFDIVAAINPHMRAADGSLQRVDKELARQQWKQLVECYQQLGCEVTVLPAAPDLPDMVFCANQTFPFLTAEGAPAIILSNMADETRHREVALLRREFEERGVLCFALPERTQDSLFEGMGDALWVPGRALICGGYGFRTSPDIYSSIAHITQAEVVLFELKHPKFYHLDTCLSILDGQSVLACREGFTEEGWAQLHRLFTTVIEVPSEEADAPGFACNAHCPDQKHVILQQGNTRTVERLRAAGFEPLEIDTSEFIKSGGSVFCLKLQCMWDAWPRSVASQVIH